MKTYIIGGAVIVGLIIGFFLLTRSNKIQPEEKRDIATCTEGSTKTIDEDIFTCVGGEWIYTGMINETKG
jgi:hypothetical protein